MNELQFKGEWKYVQGKIRERWGKLTNDDLGIINGQRDQLIGVLQKRYGILQEEAERQFHEFLDSCAPASGEHRKAA